MLARRYRDRDRAKGQGPRTPPRTTGGRMLFGERTVGMGRSGQRHRAPVAADPGPGRAALAEVLQSWSGMTSLPVTTTTAHCEAVLDEIERVVVGKRPALTLILTAVLAGGPRAHRGSARPRQDADRAIVRRRAGSGVHPGAVHAGPAARRPARLDDLRHAVGPLRIPRRAHLHQPAARRRDQPHAAQDPGGAAGGDGRGPGQHRRRNPPAARAFHRSGHRQPDRVRGHLSAAGGPARPVRHPPRTALPLRTGRGLDAAPPTGPRLGRADRHQGRGRRTNCWRCANPSSR